MGESESEHSSFSLFSVILHRVSLFLHHVELLRLLQTAACSQFLSASSLCWVPAVFCANEETRLSQLHLQQSDEILIKKLNLTVR